MNVCCSVVQQCPLSGGSALALFTSALPSRDIRLSWSYKFTSFAISIRKAHQYTGSSMVSFYLVLLLRHKSAAMDVVWRGFCTFVLTTLVFEGNVVANVATGYNKDSLILRMNCVLVDKQCFYQIY